ncbi:YcaO-like family protein, partial [Streptococcus pneumoniae]
SSIEEAIFYGILEIIERDNFLLTWYLKEEVKQLSWESLPSRLRIINERLKEDNCELKLFNITKEVGIPVIWALYI